MSKKRPANDAGPMDIKDIHAIQRRSSINLVFQAEMWRRNALGQRTTTENIHTSSSKVCSRCKKPPIGVLIFSGQYTSGLCESCSTTNAEVVSR